MRRMGRMDLVQVSNKRWRWSKCCQRTTMFSTNTWLQETSSQTENRSTQMIEAAAQLRKTRQLKTPKSSGSRDRMTAVSGRYALEDATGRLDRTTRGSLDRRKRNDTYVEAGMKQGMDVLQTESDAIMDRLSRLEDIAQVNNNSKAIPDDNFKAQLDNKRSSIDSAQRSQKLRIIDTPGKQLRLDYADRTLGKPRRPSKNETVQVQHHKYQHSQHNQNQGRSVEHKSTSLQDEAKTRISSTDSANPSKAANLDTLRTSQLTSQNKDTEYSIQHRHSPSMANRDQHLSRQSKYMKPDSSLDTPKAVCLYTQTIKSCAARGDFQRAIGVFAAMNAEGIVPDSHVYNDVVRSYRGFDGAIAVSEMADIQSLEGVLKQMHSLDISLDTDVGESVLHLYRRLAAQYGKQGVWQGALQVLGDTKKHNLQLDVSAYASIITACVEGKKFDYGLHVLRDMHKTTVKPTPRTYGVLLRGYTRTGMWEGSVALLREMQANRITPDVYTYSSVLQACAVGDAPKIASKVLEDMYKAHVEPNAVLFTNAMKATGAKGEDGWEVALSMFRSIQSRGLPVDTAAYNTLIKVCMSVNSTWAWRAGVELLDEMRTIGAMPNTATYNALIPGVFKFGGESEVDELLQAMSSDGVSANVVTYNTRLDGYSRGGRWAIAESLLAEMHACDVQPDTITYNTIIKACARGRAGNEAGRFLQLMRASGLTPDTITYKSVVTSYTRAGDFTQAYKYLSILKDMKSRLPPDVGLYSALISNCASENDHVMVLSLLRDMRKDSVVPGVQIINNVIRSCANTGELGPAVKLVRDMQSELSPTDLTAIYNTLITACIRHKKLELAHELAGGMADPAVHLDAESYNILREEGIGKAWAGRENSTEALVRSNDAQTYDKLIRHSDKYEALQLLADMQLKGLTPTPITLEKCVYESIRMEKHNLGLHVLYDMDVLGFSPVTKHYYELVTGRRWTADSSAPRLSQLNQNTSHFLALNRQIYLCARETDWQLAVKHYHTIQSASGMSPDVATYRGVVSACVRGGQVELAKTIVKEAMATDMRTHSLGMVKIYESAIHAFRESNRSTLALDVLDDYKKSGLRPHIAVYNAALNVLESDNEANLCDVVLREMRLVNITPNPSSYRYAVKACVSAGKWELAKSVTESALICASADRDYMYTQLLEACAVARQSQEALSILRDLPAKGIEPGVTMYSVVVAACGQNYELELASELLREMPWTGDRLRDYHKLYKMCGRYGGHLFSLKMLRTMQKEGVIKPDVFCYANVMKALALDHASDDCISLFKEMKAGGIAPNRGVYGSVISACEKGHKWRLAVDILREMQANDIPAGPSEFGAVLAACARAGELNTAKALWDEMEKAAAKSEKRWNLDYYSLIIMAHSRAGRTEDALVLLREAEERVPVMKAECYNAAMYGYAAVGDWGRCLGLLQECSHKQIKPTAATYNTVVKACEVGGQRELMVEVLLESLHAGLSKTDSWYRVAIEALSSDATAVRLVDILYDQMIIDVHNIHRCWSSWPVIGVIDLHNHSRVMAQAAVRRALKVCQTRWRDSAEHDRGCLSHWFSKLNVGRGKRSISRLESDTDSNIRHAVLGPVVIQYLSELQPPIRATRQESCWVVVNESDLRAWLTENTCEGDKREVDSVETTLKQELCKARHMKAADTSNESRYVLGGNQ